MKINHNRIQPKYNGKNKKTITQDDKDYLEWFSNQDIPCFVCGTYENVEGHHIKESSSDKKVHTEILPLCMYHHRLGQILSAHGTPKKFREDYPMETQRGFANEQFNRYLREIT